jgi:hypothetical protein
MKLLRSALILGICFSALTVSAQTFRPGETLDPGCLPDDNPCTVSPINLDNPIGPDLSLTPAAIGSVLFSGDDGLGNPVLKQDSDFSWDETTNTLTIGSLLQNGGLQIFGPQVNTLTHNAVSNDLLWVGSETNLTVDVSGAPVSNSSYFGSRGELMLTGNQDLTGTNIFPRHVGAEGQITNAMSGDVDRITGVSGLAFNVSTADTNIAQGFSSYVANVLSGTINNASGIGAGVAILGSGGINVASGFDMSFARLGSGMIGSGSLITLGVDGSGPTPAPGLYTVSQSVGLNLIQGALGSPALKSDGNVYAIKVDGGALDGAVNEYGIYIGDLEAKNWFAGNVGIGAAAASPTHALEVTSQTPGGIVATFNDSFTTCTLTPTLGPAALDCSSDVSLKKDIEDVAVGEVENLLKLEPVKYHLGFQDGAQEKVYGFIAQDVEPLFPELVGTNPVTGEKSVRYGGFVIPIITAIQDLYDRLDGIALQAGASLDTATDIVRKVLAGIDDIFIRKVSTEELCVGSTCLNEAQVQAILKLTEQQVTADPVVDPVAAPAAEVPVTPVDPQTPEVPVTDPVPVAPDPEPVTSPEVSTVDVPVSEPTPII